MLLMLLGFSGCRHARRLALVAKIPTKAAFGPPAHPA
jgi:hypothetical protein